MQTFTTSSGKWEVRKEPEGEEGKIIVGTFYDKLNPTVSSVAEQSAFNNSPGIFAVIFTKRAGEDNEIPIGFLYVDCSAMCMQNGRLATSRTIIPGVTAGMALTNKRLILSENIPISLEPLVMNLDSVSGIPVLESEDVKDAHQSSFVYGLIKFGNVFERMVYCAGSSSGQSQNSQGDLLLLENKTVILPGLSDVKLCRESLSSTTFVLELHNDDQLFARTFSAANVAAYHECKYGNGKASATPIKRGLSKSMSKKSVESKNTGALGKEDKFLVENCIRKTLESTRQTMYYGAARFRLEQLLSSSQDLLREFELKRQQGLVNHAEGSDRVTIQVFQ